MSTSKLARQPQTDYAKALKARQLPPVVWRQLQDKYYQLTRGAAIALMVLMVISILLNTDLQTAILFAGPTVRTPAMVQKHIENHDEQTIIRYTYTYTNLHGRPYRQSITLHRVLDSDNGQYWVEYSRWFPSRHRLMGYTASTHIALLIISLFVYALYKVTLAEYLEQRRQQLELAQYGLISKGIIISRHKLRGRGKQYRYEVAFYTYTHELIHRHFTSAKTLVAQSPILLLYWPNQPKRFIPIDSLPPAAQSYFKAQSGHTEMPIIL